MYFGQLAVICRLVMKFVVRYVVTKVCDRFFMDAVAGILCSCEHNNREI